MIIDRTFMNFNNEKSVDLGHCSSISLAQFFIHYWLYWINLNQLLLVNLLFAFYFVIFSIVGVYFQ